MSLATLILLSLSIPLFLLGLVPCLGILNWVGVPMAAATVVVAIIGLATDREPGTTRGFSTFVHLAGLVGGLLLAVLGSLRCMAGGGFF